MARYKNVNRDQMVMLPLSIDSLVPEDHLSKRIWYLINNGLIDLSPFEKGFNNDESGALAYSPRNILAVLIYAYCTGERSSRVIEKKCSEDLVFMYLSELQKPDHTTLSNFRTNHKEAFEEIFTQTVFLGIESGLIDFKHIANDGTKMSGAGSKNQIVSGDKIETRIEKCEKLVKEILMEAELTDNNKLKSKLKEKKKKIDMNLSKLYEAKKDYDLVKTPVKKDDKKIKYHLTEPEARLMKSKDGFKSGYNCQASVDSKSQMIIDKRVTQSQNDSKEGLITRKRLVSMYGKDRLYGSVMSFDNSYQNQDLISLDHEDGISLLVSQGQEGKQNSNNLSGPGIYKYNREKDIFICPADKELRYYREKKLENRLFREYKLTGCSNCSKQDICFKKNAKNKRQKSILVNVESLDKREKYEKFQIKMRSEEIVEEYKKRFSTVEPVYAHMTTRKRFERFSLWGMAKANIEFTLASICHNILKLLKYGKLQESLS